MTRRVKHKNNGEMTYLVIEESEYDMKIEVLDWVWKDDFIDCTEEDLINLPTASQIAMELTKMD